MRIIAGNLGGRQFESPKTNRTHPMSEKMRGALFNALGDIKGLEILDAFAGSGACAFEAISRGAKSVIAIEQDTEAFKTINKNIQNLGLEEQIKAVRANVAGWVSNYKWHLFDIIIADPPYEPKNLDLHLVFKVSANVKPGGIFVVSSPPDQKDTRDLRARKTKNLELIAEKKYGDGSLAFYRKIKN
jgi:16S rRNA (guanine966-N2)-methyltransferase